MDVKKYLYLAAGWASVGLAILGIILPIFPTTPFLLVAVWAFSRSSPELAERIRNHKTFGPLVRNWQDAGVIPIKAKIAAFLMMIGTSTYVWFYSPAPKWMAVVAIIAMAAISLYVARQPSRRS